MTKADLLTTAQVAEMHETSPRSIREIAQRRGVRPHIDEPRYKMWTRKQAIALAPDKSRRPGRPKSIE